MWDALGSYLTSLLIGLGVSLAMADAIVIVARGNEPIRLFRHYDASSSNLQGCVFADCPILAPLPTCNSVGLTTIEFFIE